MATKKIKAKKKTPPKKKARKASPKKPAGAPATPKTPVSKITLEQQIVGAKFLGKVVDYFSHLGVMTLVLESPLAVGETIRVKGHTTDLTQKVESIQEEHKSLQSAVSGEAVGIKVADKTRIGDAVYKI